MPMESQISTTSASVSEATGVGTAFAGLTKGTQKVIVLTKDTYLLDRNNQLIPIPAGTKAVELDDSDDEQSKSTVVSSTEVSKTEMVHGEENDVCLPSSTDNSEATASAPEASSSTTLESEYQPVLSSDNVNRVTTTEEEVQTTVPCEPVVMDSEAQPDVIDEEVQEAAPPNPSISASDLYVQEEEEVMMDESCLAVDASSQPVRDGKTADFGHSSGGEDSISSHVETKAAKRVGPKKSVKGQQLVVEKSSLSTSLPDKTLVKQGKVNVRSAHDKQDPSSVVVQEKTTAKQSKASTKASADDNESTKVTPTVSACGRPQRSVHRRTAYELLHGTEGKPLARRQALGGPESEPEPSPVQKVMKKQPKQGSGKTGDVDESKTLTAMAEQPGHGRGRRRICKTLDSSSPGHVSSPARDTPSPPKESTSDHLVAESNTDSVKAENIQTTEIVNSAKCTEDNLEETATSNTEEVKKINEVVECPVTEFTAEVSPAVAEEAMSKIPTDVPVKSEDSSALCMEEDEQKSCKKRGRPKRICAPDVSEEKSECSSEKQGVPPVLEESVKKRRKKADIEPKAKQSSSNNEKAVSSTVESVSVAGPGFPYESFTLGKLHSGLDVGDHDNSEEGEHGNGEKYQPNSLSEHLKSNASRLWDEEENWMVKKIQELEAEVVALQEKVSDAEKQEKNLEEANRPSKLWLSVVAEVQDSNSEGGTKDSVILSQLDRKLRKLDRELDDRAASLKIREGRIARRERRILEKERLLGQRERSLELRFHQEGPVMLSEAGNDSSVKESTGPSTSKPGRVNLLNKEMKLELREQELDRQKIFLEDERKKLVAKERELVCREQALVDADLKNLVSVVSVSTPETSEKQHNGKVVAEFSDNEDDDSNERNLNSFSALGSSSSRPFTTQNLGKDFDSDDDDDDEVPLSRSLGACISSITNSSEAESLDTTSLSVARKRHLDDDDLNVETSKVLKQSS